ncbi:protein TASOR 2 [Eudromia elegans]
MGERRDGAAAAAGGTGLHLESEESSSLLQTAVSVLQNSYLDCASRDGFQYSQAILVENDVFLNELKAFAQAKEAAGYSQEELEETFAFLLFDNEDEAKEVCQTGLRINTSSISTLGDPAKGVYISKYADCLHPRPWHHGKSGYIVIFKLIKGKVKAVCENHTSSYTCPSPGYDCHIAVSRNTGTSRGSPFQAFEQSQYYVYEVSGGSVAERPRQICPYMVIACQYKEPKGMPLLARESLPDLNHKASYCPWRGQLSIQGQLLCSIALRTPFSSTMPAQLPPNLDMSHVMGLSDLKKKLPAAAFGKSNYTRNEVCFQGIYFSLYEVEISNKEQHKMDELLQNLKEKDLAIIKYLQDQGVLILLTSAALTGDDVFDPKEPISLLALFLFTSSRSVCPRADQQDPKAEREDGGISLKIASVLPGLQYAMEKATKSSHGDPVSTGVQIKRYFQEFAKLEQNAQPTSGQNSPVPLSSLLSPAEEEGTNPLTKCSEQSFSQLQRYLSDPSSYSLEISAALGCLAGAAQSLCCSSEAVCNVDSSLVVPPDPVPPLKVKNETANAAAGLTQGGKGTTADVSSASKLRVQQSKRKSSRPVVTSNRKKWSPLKMQIHPVGDGGRNRKANKKKKINFAFPKKPGLAASSSEPMLKLANLQFPHRRKREPKEPISVPPSETLCKNHGASSVVSGIYPAEDVVLQGNDYESHALNLLADLALGSCIPALVPTGAVTEQRSQRRPRTSRSAFDHEYHRMDRLAKGGTSPGKSSPNHKLEKPAGKTDLKKDSALTTREKSPGISSKKSSLSPSSAKPSEAQEPAEATKPSFISSEHSYASQMPEHARKPPPPRGMPHPMASVAKNGARSGLPGPLVGKVVPWQRCGGGPAVRRPAAARPREEFAKTHTVMRRGGSVTVTCRCEAEYLFSLDSRYTRDALEKTVIRALHGPWDPDLPDDVEETKLILHMWVALFYSKPSKLLSSTRKVVEHSNPKKFVSINSTGDFLELSDDSEDCFGLETCPADSQSDPDRIPSLPEPGTRSQGPFCAEQSPADSQMDAEGTRGVVDSTVSSSVGELPCVEEPSSTSFPESPSLSVRAEGSSPMGGDEWPAQDIPGTPPEELPREEPLDTAATPGPSEELDPTLGSSCSDSDQEGFGGTVWELRTSRASYSMKSLDAADTGSSWDASSVGSERADGHSEGWSSPGAREGWWQPEPPYVTIPDERGVPRDYVNFTVTRRHRDVGAWQPEQRCSRHEGHSHLLRSLVGTRRTSTDITQGTLDLECLRFHYKLNQILRSRKPPSSTSESIFPRDSPGLVPPGLCPGRAALAPRSRSPLQVTLLRSATGPDGATWHCAAPGHLRKLRYDGQPQDTRGDIAGILDEYAEFGRVMLGRVGTGLARGATAPPCTPRPHRHQPSAFGDMITNLCSSLRFRLRRVARDARAGLFYVVETGEDLFFARAKALLEKDGHKETEPLRFCRATRLASERLLVVIRNEDISSHIHKVPCLLRLKHCPDVVFAGVDQPEDLPGRTYQELFHMGGFVVSGDEVLETVTLGQLKEVVKVLEKLNGSGRWKWLLHYKESKKLREDLRVDANARKKNLILKSCQGADLVEVLHYHACDSGASPKAEYLKCLLNLQVQRVSARFAVYLTARLRREDGDGSGSSEGVAEKPALSKEVLESQGILVADVNTFLGTMQQVAAPFRRSYW